MSLESLRDVKPGDRVTVEGYGGTIKPLRASDPGSFTATVLRVGDENGRNTSWVDISRLDKALPYADGQLYISEDGRGALYTFRAAGASGKPGWVTQGGTARGIDQPIRPLRAVTFSDPISE